MQQVVSKLAGLRQQSLVSTVLPCRHRSVAITTRSHGSGAPDGTPTLTPAQQSFVDVWEEHMKCEFATKNVDDTMVTMIEGAYVNHVPTMTGGVGLEAVRDFYSNHFIPRMPPDVETVPVSRTVGDTQIVDEMIFKFTHTVPMDWMLPGIAPTGKRVEVGLVAVIGIREGKVCHERIYWDQASVLAQLGLLDVTSGSLPVAGIESAQKIANPSLPSNTLIQRHMAKA